MSLSTEHYVSQRRSFSLLPPSQLASQASGSTDQSLDKAPDTAPDTAPGIAPDTIVNDGSHVTAPAQSHPDLTRLTQPFEMEEPAEVQNHDPPQYTTELK